MLTQVLSVMRAVSIIIFIAQTNCVQGMQNPKIHYSRPPQPGQSFQQSSQPLYQDTRLFYPASYSNPPQHQGYYAHSAAQQQVLHRAPQLPISQATQNPYMALAENDLGLEESMLVCTFHREFGPRVYEQSSYNAGYITLQNSRGHTSLHTALYKEYFILANLFFDALDETNKRFILTLKDENGNTIPHKIYKKLAWLLKKPITTKSARESIIQQELIDFANKTISFADTAIPDHTARSIDCCRKECLDLWRKAEQASQATIKKQAARPPSPERLVEITDDKQSSSATSIATDSKGLVTTVARPVITEPSHVKQKVTVEEDLVVTMVKPEQPQASSQRREITVDVVTKSLIDQSAVASGSVAFVETKIPAHLIAPTLSLQSKTPIDSEPFRDLATEIQSEQLARQKATELLKSTLGVKKVVPVETDIQSRAKASGNGSTQPLQKTSMPKHVVGQSQGNTRPQSYTTHRAGDKIADPAASSYKASRDTNYPEQRDASSRKKSYAGLQETRHSGYKKGTDNIHQQQAQPSLTPISNPPVKLASGKSSTTAIATQPLLRNAFASLDDKGEEDDDAPTELVHTTVKLVANGKEPSLSPLEELFDTLGRDLKYFNAAIKKLKKTKIESWYNEAGQTPLYAALAIEEDIERATLLAQAFPNLVRLHNKDNEKESPLNWIFDTTDKELAAAALREWDLLGIINLKQKYRGEKTIEQIAQEAGILPTDEEILKATNDAAVAEESAKKTSKKKKKQKSLQDQKLSILTFATAPEEADQIEHELVEQIASKMLPKRQKVAVAKKPADDQICAEILTMFSSLLTSQEERFRKALNEGDITTLEKHQSMGARIQTTMQIGWPAGEYRTIQTPRIDWCGAFILAMRSQNLKSIRYVLSKMADLNIILDAEMSNQTLLMYTLRELSSINVHESFILVIVKAFCERFRPGEINIADALGQTALHVAAINFELPALITILLEHGADQTALDAKCNTAIDCVIDKASSQACLHALVSHEATKINMVEAIIRTMHHNPFIALYFDAHPEILLSWIAAKGRQNVIPFLTGTGAVHILPKLRTIAPDLIAQYLMRPFLANDAEGTKNYVNALLLAAKMLQIATIKTINERVQNIYREYIHIVLELVSLNDWLEITAETISQEAKKNLQELLALDSTINVDVAPIPLGMIIHTSWDDDTDSEAEVQEVRIIAELATLDEPLAAVEKRFEVSYLTEIQQQLLIPAIYSFNQAVLDTYKDSELKLLFKAICKPNSDELVMCMAEEYYGALLHAVEARNLKSVRYFCNLITHFNKPIDLNKTTLLHHILQLFCHKQEDAFLLKVVQILCEDMSKIDINNANIKGFTALHIAASDYEYPALLKFLLSKNANPTALNTFQLVPLDYALRHASVHSRNLERALECVEILMQADTRSIAEKSKHFLQVVSMITSYQFFDLLCVHQPEAVAFSLIRPFEGKDKAFTNALLVTLQFINAAPTTGAKKREYIDFLYKLLSLAPLEVWFRNLTEEQVALCEELLKDPAIESTNVEHIPLFDEAGSVFEVAMQWD